VATVTDVATCILQLHGPMTAMKLQKLVYYVQAWALVWDLKPLFDEDIEAGSTGPICPNLARLYGCETFLGKTSMDSFGRAGSLSPLEVATIRAVMFTYGDKTLAWLSDLIHKEDPWRNARNGKDSGERGNTVISLTALYDYYSRL
jgi:uncharacterized phage-associated protein